LSHTTGTREVCNSRDKAVIALLEGSVRVVRLAALLFLAFVGSSAAQQPSGRLAEVGWQALRDGEAERALSSFREALTLRPGDPTLHIGLGVAEHLLGREDEARKSLERALKIDPRLSVASTLLGEIAYRQGDVDTAIRVYEDAISRNVGDVRMKARLEEWRKEASMHRGFESRNDDRFSVMFEGPAEEQLAARATTVLTAAFWRIGKGLGHYPSNSISVVLYTQKQFRDITRAPDWSAGLYDGRIRIPVRGAEQNLATFDRVLTHELTHAMIANVAPRGVPTWLHEGLAQHFEQADAAAAERRFRATRLFIPLTDLEGGFTELNGSAAVIAYDESFIVVRTLLDRVGTNLGFLIQDLGAGQTIDQAILRFGITYPEFQDEVIRRLGFRMRQSQ
jgi:Peptidase MA superfamily/Tetratricopeptide repeat